MSTIRLFHSVHMHMFCGQLVCALRWLGSVTNRSAYLFLAVMALFGLSCAERGRSNPLDPKNPTTNGSPVGLTVRDADNTSVLLLWPNLDLKDLTEYRIYRTEPDQDFSQEIARVPADTNNFRDTHLSSGVVYSYEMSAVSGRTESGRSEKILVEPGPTYTYVGTRRGRALSKYTHDSRYRVSTGEANFDSIIDLEYSVAGDALWVIDAVVFPRGIIKRIGMEDMEVEEIMSLGEPTDLEIDSERGSVWVADADSGIVAKMTENGVVEFVAGNFIEPVALAVDEVSGDCWVLDARNKSLLRLSVDGTQRTVATVNPSQARSVAVDQRDGSVWVAEDKRLLKLSRAGGLINIISRVFQSLYRIKIDRQDGSIWALDRGADIVIKFNSLGVEVYSYDELYRAIDLAVNPFDGDCVVVDQYNNRIVRLASDGRQQAVTTAMSLPQAVTFVQRQ